MDAFVRWPGPSSTALSAAQTELRWMDSELWPVRRPYPIEVPCPACGALTRCDFFGRQHCPNGHAFGQRAFWGGRTAACWLLIEDLSDGRTLIFPDAPVRWHDEIRHIAGDAPHAGSATSA